MNESNPTVSAETGTATPISMALRANSTGTQSEPLGKLHFVRFGIHATSRL